MAGRRTGGRPTSACDFIGRGRASGTRRDGCAMPLMSAEDRALLLSHAIEWRKKKNGLAAEASNPLI